MNDLSNLRKKCGIPFGKIRNTSLLSKRIGVLYLDEELSDIVLVVENEKLFAHKIILAACSEYFRALLFGGMRESSQNEIIMTECKVDVFKVLLEFTYTGSITPDSCRENFILEVLELAHRFAFVDLEDAICDYLKKAMTTQNCCLIDDTARLYNLTNLMRESSLYIDRHAEEILSHVSFLDLSLESLKRYIKRDSFFVSEVLIFKSVLRWFEVNKNVSPESLPETLNLVRLPLMSVEELLTVVKPTGLVSPIDLLHAIEIVTLDKPSNEINYRGVMQAECNMAVKERGAVVLKGSNGSLLINEKFIYERNSICTYHYIRKDAEPNFILIELGTQCVTNYIKMLLWDLDSRSHSYRVEVSVNQKNWTQVIDHSQHLCRSWQYLYFDPTVVKYVKISGTNSTASDAFLVVHFEIMYTDKPYTVEEMFSVPKHNVAVCELSANVIEGTSEVKNSLLDGNIKLHEDQKGCTSHKLNNGCILIQLGQPYVIDSLRFLLWDLDHAMYSYLIEVSVNKSDWEIIADKTEKQCTSWQTLHFPKRPIVFIRITGTKNTADDMFRVVHFECPAQVF